MVRRAGPWVSSLSAIPYGLFVGANVLVLAVFLTGNRALGVAAAAASVVASAGFLGYRSALRMPPSPGAHVLLPVTLSIGSLALGGLIAWGLILAPAPAGVPPGGFTATWDLPTGSRIAYRHVQGAGPTHPTPVILVHGGPGSPDPGAVALAEDLARDGFDVYAFHQLGAGLSSRLDDVQQYTVARQVADLDAIRSAIGAERVMLVGASWGATLIANYLAAYPDRVERAVVSSPGGMWAPAFTDATRLSQGGRADQGAVITRHPRFLLAHGLLSLIGPQAACGAPAR